MPTHRFHRDELYDLIDNYREVWNDCISVEPQCNKILHVLRDNAFTRHKVSLYGVLDLMGDEDEDLIRALVVLIAIIGSERLAILMSNPWCIAETLNGIRVHMGVIRSFSLDPVMLVVKIITEHFNQYNQPTDYATGIPKTLAYLGFDATDFTGLSKNYLDDMCSRRLIFH